LGDIKHVQVVSRQPHAFFAPFLRNGDKLPDAAAPAIIERFASMMKRGRSADTETVEKLTVVFEQGRELGMPFWEALVEPLAISMCSMESILHFENRSPAKDARTISGVELANRLSYTLWRSAPDDELIRLGRTGSLLEERVKAQQVTRMMADAKFDRFLRDFTDQWFELPRQDEIAVDPRVYKHFDVHVQPAMKEETIQFMAHVVREDLPLTNLIDSDFMMLNNAMARHYGVPGVIGNEFRAVTRTAHDAGRHRGGILTHAGILMQGGTGDRTSIVERGAFIARKLINDPPRPPPPNAGELPTDDADTARMTGAELVRHHASAPQCANCHAGIDPLGMGLEAYDAVGLFRTREVRLRPGYDRARRKPKGGPVFNVAIDTAGTLNDGQRFDGIEEFKRVLLSQEDQLARGVVQALLSFTNGRDSNVADDAIVDRIMQKTAAQNYPARRIIREVVLSDAMTTY